MEAATGCARMTGSWPRSVRPSVTWRVPGVTGTANGGVELIKLLASSEDVETCFASHWIEFAYGRALDAADACNKQTLQTAFKNSGYNVKQMLLAITQTDGFLSRPAQ